MPDPSTHHATLRAVRVGVVVLMVSIAGLCAPLGIPMGQSAKYVVAPAFIGACAALSILLNAAIDWIRKD